MGILLLMKQNSATKRKKKITAVGYIAFYMFETNYASIHKYGKQGFSVKYSNPVCIKSCRKVPSSQHKTMLIKESADCCANRLVCVRATEVCLNSNIKMFADLTKKMCPIR